MLRCNQVEDLKSLTGSGVDLVQFKGHGWLDQIWEVEGPHEMFCPTSDHSVINLWLIHFSCKMNKIK